MSDQLTSCRHCGKDNPAQAVYCISCGGAIHIACVNCEQMNPASATHCSKCGRDLNDFDNAQKLLEQAFTYLSNGDHVAALETAKQGLKQFHSLSTEFDETRRKAADIINGHREEILEILKQVHGLLKQHNHPAAEELISKAYQQIDHERGAEDMRPKADQLRDALKRITDDYNKRTSKAATLAADSLWRDASTHVNAMIDDYKWDSSLAARLIEIRQHMSEADGYASDTEHALSQRDFQEAQHHCEKIRSIEPDHPQLEEFEQ